MNGLHLTKQIHLSEHFYGEPGTQAYMVHHIHHDFNLLASLYEAIQHWLKLSTWML